MVELCQSRVNILKMDEAKILEEAKNINMTTIQQVIKRVGTRVQLFSLSFVLRKIVAFSNE